MNDLRRLKLEVPVPDDRVALSTVIAHERFHPIEEKVRTPVIGEKGGYPDRGLQYDEEPQIDSEGEENFLA